MMKRLIRIGSILTVLVLVGLGIWSYGYIRRIDGRSPAQWLTFADHAGQMTAYHAEGFSQADSARAHFVLEQGTDGRYVLTTRDAQGRVCTLGYDGSQVWYSTNTKQDKITVKQALTPSLPERARILGTGTIAGRPVVRLAVSNGRMHKRLAIDRQTGILLAMETRVNRQVMSDMVIQRIAYREVEVPSCTLSCSPRANAVDRVTLEAHLGGKLLEPRWLPDGFVLTDMLLEWCSECGKPMGVLRYSDGISAITLFEMSRHAMMCRMGETCRQTGDEAHTVVETMTFKGHMVTAVGTGEARMLKKILGSMH